MHLTPAFLSDPALGAVLAALPEARLVGGCVRDAVLGVAAADIDLATPRPPDQVMAALRGAGLGAVPTGIAHGTVTAVSKDRGFEVTTLRRDVATDGRHAMVAYTDDWVVDAARRDFTFNALSMAPDGTVHDPFGGIADLRAGIVRFVGDPVLRLAEDRLRALRYIRFFGRFGAIPPDAATAQALRSAAPALGLLSAERVAAEMLRILGLPDPRPALRLMAELGMQAVVLPEAGDPASLDPSLPADPLLRLAALIHVSDGGAAVARRWRLSSMQTDRLAGLLAGPVPREQDDDAALRRLLSDIPPALLIDRVRLHGGPAVLQDRLAALPVPVFPLAGRDLLALGRPPGPAIGTALARVRQWWRDGGCVADRDACLAALGRLG